MFKLKKEYLFLFTALALYFGGVAFHVSTEYIAEREQLWQEINEKIEIAARSAITVTSGDLRHWEEDGGKLPEELYRTLVDKLTEMRRLHHVQTVYVVAEYEGATVCIARSMSERELADWNYPLPFESCFPRHSAVFSEQKPALFDYQKKGKTYRTFLSSPQYFGDITYATAADYPLDGVDRQVMREAIYHLALGIFMLIIVLPLIAVYIKSVRNEFQRFKALVDQSLAGIYIIQDERFTYVNRKMAEMFGKSQKDVTEQKDIYNNIHPDDRNIVKENIGQRISGEKESIHYQLRFVKENGEIVHAEVYGTGIQLDGKPTILGLVLDITKRVQAEQELIQYRNKLEELVQERTEELSASNDTLTKEIAVRKKIEKQLKESEKKYHGLYDSIFDGVFLADIEGNILESNRAFKKMLNLKQSDLEKGISTSSITPEKWHALDKDVLEKEILTRGYADEYEKEYCRTDGTCFPVSIRKWLIRDAEGNPSYLWGVARDITERKNFEYKLEKAHQDTLRSKEKLEHALELSERMTIEAHAANIAKSEFLANMSHEIRTPMNGIIGMSALLSQSPLQEDQKEFVSIIQTSAHSLLTVINDILDFSKIEAGKLDIKEEAFELRQAVDNVMDIISLNAYEKGLEIGSFVEAQVPFCIKGDEVRLQQLLTNILSNAVKFTEKGHILLRVSLRERDEDNVRIAFAVEDTGIGIPEEKQHLLFTSFSQIDGSSNRQYEGTGLGLAISKRLVELMGGEIHVSSTEGKGSCFQFDIQAKHITSPLSVSEEWTQKGDILILSDGTLSSVLLKEYFDEIPSISSSVLNEEEGTLFLQKHLEKKEKPLAILLIDFRSALQTAELALRCCNSFSDAFTRIILLHNRGEGSVISFNKEEFSRHYCTLTRPIKRSRLFSTLQDCCKEKKEKPPAALSPRPATPQAEAGDAQKQLKVLLADDHDANQVLLKTVLQKKGCSVRCVSNGKEAIEAYRSEKFDIIFMDIQMPEMDGFEATKQIREKEKEKKRETHIPIIALTANAMKGDRERCLKAGMDDYIPKPIKFQDVYRVIENLQSYTGSPPSGSKKKVSSPPAASTTSEEPAIFDAEAVWDDVDKNPTLFQHIIQLLKEGIPPRLEAIDAALKQKKLKDAGKEAHTLKGNTYGALRLQETLKEFITACNDEKEKKVKTLRKRIQEEYLALKKEIEKLHTKP